MPLVFLPLDGLSHTKLHGLLPRRGNHAPDKNHEQLLRCGFVPADHAVELGQRHVDVAACDPRMPKTLRAEVLDRARRELADDPHPTKATWPFTPIR